MGQPAWRARSLLDGPRAFWSTSCLLLWLVSWCRLSVGSSAGAVGQGSPWMLGLLSRVVADFLEGTSQKNQEETICLSWPSLRSHNITGLAVARPIHAKESELRPHLLMEGKLKSHSKKSWWRGDLIWPSLENRSAIPTARGERLWDREVAQMPCHSVASSSLLLRFLKGGSVG